MTDKPLTQPQRLLLMELVRRGPQNVAPHWPPAKNLIKRGLAELSDYNLLAVTPAGVIFYNETSAE